MLLETIRFEHQLPGTADLEDLPDRNQLLALTGEHCLLHQLIVHSNRPRVVVMSTRNDSRAVIRYVVKKT